MILAGPRKGTTCADEVTLSLKGANSPTRGRKLRSTGTKTRAHVSNEPTLIELKEQLEARTRELAEARGHLSEALEQQTATSEILRVLRASLADIQPVLDVIVRNASRLCEAEYVELLLRDGDVLKLAASHGSLPTAAEARPIRRTLVTGRVIMDGRARSGGGLTAAWARGVQADSARVPGCVFESLRNACPERDEGRAPGAHRTVDR